MSLSGLAYVATGIVVVALALWIAIRATSRSSRSAGRAETEAVAAQKVADDARAANAVRADVGAAGGDELRRRLSPWTRD